MADKEGWTNVEVRGSVFIDSPSHVIVLDENAIEAIVNQRTLMKGGK